MIYWVIFSILPIQYFKPLKKCETLIDKYKLIGIHMIISIRKHNKQMSHTIYVAKKSVGNFFLIFHTTSKKQLGTKLTSFYMHVAIYRCMLCTLPDFVDLFILHIRSPQRDPQCDERTCRNCFLKKVDSILEDTFKMYLWILIAKLLFFFQLLWITEHAT